MRKYKVVIIILFSLIPLFLITLKLNRKNQMNRTLKVGLNLNNKSIDIDPLVVPTITDAFFLHHLYGNLIEYNNDGHIVADLSSNFYWDKNTLIFDFEGNLKDSIGNLIDAKTAEFSIKRVLFSKKQFHASILEIICENDETLDACSERIFSKDNKLFIKVADSKKTSFLLPALASVDYKIVPLTAFDNLDYKKAKIINYEIASGAYSLKSKDDKKFVFSVNTYSHHYTNAIAEQFEVYGIPLENLLETARKENFDVLTTTLPLSNNDIKAFDMSLWEIFESYPLCIEFLSFSQKALLRLSTEDRIFFSENLYSIIEEQTGSFGLPTKQFFQTFGQGFLSNSQLSAIDQQRNEVMKSHQLKNDISLGSFRPERLKRFTDLNKNFRLKKISKIASFLPEDEKPDAFFVSLDVSFDISLTLLAFTTKAGFLGLENKSSDEIIKEFLNLPSPEKQIEFLNAIHFYSIKNAIMYPMFASPYRTVLRRDLKQELSKFNSRTLMWKIKFK